MSAIDDEFKRVWQAYPGQSYGNSPAAAPLPPIDNALNRFDGMLDRLERLADVSATQADRLCGHELTCEATPTPFNDGPGLPGHIQRRLDRLSLIADALAHNLERLAAL